MDFAAQKRYWEKVDVRGLDDCWEWTAYRDKIGYGAFGWAQRVHKAHRVSWQLAHPDEDLVGRCVLHRCDNPSCVNPAHLIAGTQLENIKDRNEKGRQSAGARHGSAKITAVQVYAIREDPRSQRMIARAHGISHTEVGAIKRREKWAHLS